MGRYNRYRPQAKWALSDGDSVNFYEPDQLLSQQMSPKSLMKTEVAIRETAWNYYRVLGYLPNPSETLRKLGKDIGEYKYLLEDAHVNGVFSSRKAGSLSLNWILDRNDIPVRQYQTIKSLLDNWPVYDIMQEMLNCVWFGYQPLEVVWEKVGGMILPKEFTPKDPDWFRFSDINEARYLTKRNMVTGEPIPPFKFIMAKYRPSYERPYGRPVASTCYWACKMRHAGFRFFTQFVEKYGQPWVMAKYPLGTQQARVQEMLDMVTDCIQDGVVAFPKEFETESLDVNKTSSAEIFKMFIDICNREIAISLLGQELTTSTTGNGSYALGKVHHAVREDIVAEDKRIIENAFCTLISWIYEMNWKTDTQPVFKLVEEPEISKDESEIAKNLFSIGVKFKKEYFQSHFQLSESEFDVGEAPVPAGIGGISPSNAVEDQPKGSANVIRATHDVNDPAEKQSTYDSTKDAVKNLTRR